MPEITQARATSISLADLDSRLLRYFLSVVQEGSIRKAADKQNVAASAISRQVSDLEARLGLRLLDRLPRGVTPTEAGDAVAAHARQQAEEGEQLVEYLKQLHGLRHGAVRIACGEGFVGDLVENGLPPFLAAYPNVRLQMTLGGTAEILTSVAEGRADVGLAYNPQSHPGLRSAAISRQPLRAVLAPSHPLTPRGAVPLASFASYPAALLSPPYGIRQLIGRVEADEGFHLTVIAEAESIDVARRLAIHCSLVTFLPEFAAASEIASGALLAVPLTDPLLTEASAHLVVRVRRRLPEAVDRLVTSLIEGMRAFQDTKPIG
jgi:DNA-binding transcriptional LysR family regulator